MTTNTCDSNGNCGLVIRPIIDHEGVKLLAERLYGISVLEVTDLNGYDDKNYKIVADPNVENPITSHSEHGYVLKIMNYLSSEVTYVNNIEAQNEVMNFLATGSITCPKPVRNVYGHQYSIENIGGKKHAVRLLEYVPGELLQGVPKSEALFYQLGEFVANMDNKLQNFNHSGLVGRQHLWMLTIVPDLDKFMYVITDSEKVELANEVIEEFKDVVLPRLDELEKGVIHGDVTEMNVIVGLKSGSETDYRVTGIIDFGDVQYSYYVFELAIAMTYMMLTTGDPRIGGYVLAGYTANRRLPDLEYKLLKTLVSARLVQSLVLGAYDLGLYRGQPCVIPIQRADGWELLKKIRESKKTEELHPADWKEIAKEYLARS